MPRLVEGPLTPGLTKALSKQKVLASCACGFPMPVYPGRYPSKCPICGEARQGKKDAAGSGTDGSPR